MFKFQSFLGRPSVLINSYYFFDRNWSRRVPYNYTPVAYCQRTDERIWKLFDGLVMYTRARETTTPIVFTNFCRPELSGFPENTYTRRCIGISPSLPPPRRKGRSFSTTTLFYFAFICLKTPRVLFTVHVFAYKIKYDNHSACIYIYI